MGRGPRPTSPPTTAAAGPATTRPPSWAPIRTPGRGSCASGSTWSCPSRTSSAPSSTGVVARYDREGAPLIDGVVDAVRRIAADYRVAVASSAHADVIAAALASTGLTETFEVVVSSDEVAHGKPAPDVYLEVARRLGVSPASALVVEDSRNGVRAAKAAGMTVVLVPNASVPPAPGTADLADMVLDRLADLDPAAVRSASTP